MDRETQIKKIDLSLDKEAGFELSQDFERFNQINDIFSRAFWDETVRNESSDAFFESHRVQPAGKRASGFGQKDFALRNAAENWMATMNSHQGNISAVAPNDMLGEATVKQFTRAGNTVGTWEFKNIFPVNVSEIALDWSTNDTIEEFTIEWAYDYWTHSPAAL